MININKILTGRPVASAIIRGSEKYPKIRGTVRFHQTQFGILVSAEISGLPASKDKCKSPIFAFHIHEGEECSGNEADPFANAKTHYNPNNCKHPYHAGDMPPLFGNSGYAVSVFLTDRFTLKEILGKTVIIHSGIDDFSTQPSGNAGEKIACGQIKKI